MTKAAALSGLAPTIPVAIEQNYPENERIISDSLASSMLPSGVRAFVWVLQYSALREWFVKTIEKKSPGIWAGLLCRKRYIDEKLFELDRECEAIVNLGAGFDTRVYRMPASHTVPTWEVDLPENIALKTNRLAKVFGQIPHHIQLIPADFERDELSSVLSAHRYSSNMQTFYIGEAVLQFLTKAGVQTTLDFLSKAKQGSRLIFTYILKDFITGDNLYGQEKTYQQFVRKGVWGFGLDPGEVSNFLEPYGWKVLEHFEYEELAERYLDATGRKLPALPIERIVLAGKN